MSDLVPEIRKHFQFRLMQRDHRKFEFWAGQIRLNGIPGTASEVDFRDEILDRCRQEVVGTSFDSLDTKFVVSIDEFPTVHVEMYRKLTEEEIENSSLWEG